MRAAKVQASLRIRAVSPEPSLLAHTSSESRGTFRQKARSLVPVNGWACAVKVCHVGMLEDTNSLDGAQITWQVILWGHMNLINCSKSHVYGEMSWEKTGLRFYSWPYRNRHEPPRDKTNKMACGPSERLRSAWALAQSDQSSLPVWRKLGSLANH